jgi:fimbrial chaperone protein
MRRAVPAALLGAAMASFAPASGARGQLQAAPTLVELAPGAGAGRMTLSNTGDAPLAAQVRVFAWSQVEGEDRLGATGEVVVSPAIVQIAPGASQMVRVVRLGAAPEARDASYRIVVDELPTPDETPETGIQIRMRYVVPVYVRAAKATPPALQCRLQSAQLACSNAGGRAAQLGATRLVDGHGHAVALTPGLFGYVLPASERRWALDAAQVGKLTGELQLETRSNGQPLTLPVSRAP